MLAQRGASTERLLLAGVALNALLGAVTSYVLSQYAGLYERNTQILFWLLGGLEDRTWEHVLMGTPILAGRRRCGRSAGRWTCSASANARRKVSAWMCAGCGAGCWRSRPCSPLWPRRSPAR